MENLEKLRNLYKKYMNKKKYLDWGLYSAVVLSILIKAIFYGNGIVAPLEIGFLILLLGILFFQKRNEGKIYDAREDYLSHLKIILYQGQSLNEMLRPTYSDSAITELKSFVYYTEKGMKKKKDLTLSTRIGDKKFLKSYSFQGNKILFEWE